MNDKLFLSQLEDVAYKLGIAVRYEKINLRESSSTGGVCRIRGKFAFIIDG